MKNPFRIIKKKVKEVDLKIRFYALNLIVQNLKDSKKACEQHSTSIINLGKLGMVGQSFEEALKNIRKNPQSNQNDIKTQQELYDWVRQTIHAWKEKNWAEIDFECWELIIQNFEKELTQTAGKIAENTS